MTSRYTFHCEPAWMSAQAAACSCSCSPYFTFALQKLLRWPVCNGRIRSQRSCSNWQHNESCCLSCKFELLSAVIGSSGDRSAVHCRVYSSLQPTLHCTRVSIAIQLWDVRHDHSLTEIAQVFPDAKADIQAHAHESRCKALTTQNRRSPLATEHLCQVMSAQAVAPSPLLQGPGTSEHTIHVYNPCRGAHPAPSALSSRPQAPKECCTVAKGRSRCVLTSRVAAQPPTHISSASACAAVGLAGGRNTRQPASTPLPARLSQVTPAATQASSSMEVFSSCSAWRWSVAASKAASADSASSCAHAGTRGTQERPCVSREVLLHPLDGLLHQHV